MLGRLSPAQLIREAEELLSKRALPRPTIFDLFPISFANGGPGEPGPHEPRPPADFVQWRAGGSLPSTTEGLDWWITHLKLEDSV